MSVVRSNRREFTVKRGNRRVLQVRVEREQADGTWRPLATSPGDITSLVFRMRSRAGGTLKIDDATASVVTATATDCVLQYVLTEANLDTADEYQAELYAVMANGEKLTVPSDDFLLIRVVEGLK